MVFCKQKNQTVSTPLKIDNFSELTLRVKTRLGKLSIIHFVPESYQQKKRVSTFKSRNSFFC